MITKYGDKYEGVVTNALNPTSNSILSLRMTRNISDEPLNPQNGVVPNANNMVGAGSQYAMNFDLQDVADVIVNDLSTPQPSKLQNGRSLSDEQRRNMTDKAVGAGSAFQTDMGISGHRDVRERELKPWIPEGDGGIDASLESGGHVAWDQFETNERLFGTTSTYDESHYTTQIDRSSPSYKIREERARKIAQEIEGKLGETAHLREERGQALEEDAEDEESKYSGVRRELTPNYAPLLTGTPNTYTPPARRPPSSQPTVSGAPVDPAIISAQLSRPDGVKVALPRNGLKMNEAKANDNKLVPASGILAVPSTTSIDKPEQSSMNASSQIKGSDKTTTKLDLAASASENVLPENETEGVETRVLEKFRQFATAEKLKLTERKRAQASQDRTAKLNDLKRFSSSFRLKTPIPVDLVGILAKDPAKQEQIMEKARFEHEQTGVPANTQDPGAPDATTVPGDDSLPAVAKFDASMMPAPLPADRQSFLALRNRDRLPVQTGRNERSNQNPTAFAGRGAPLYSQRPSAMNQDRKQAPVPVPAPIPLPDPRMPSGPVVDQSNLSSPQRSSLHTPTSAVSAKFNAKAHEFRPNVNAAVFNPTSSNAPSSPASAQRAASVSRTATPSSFFGTRKPLAVADRPRISKHFNPIIKMKSTEEQRKRDKEAGKEVPNYKDYASNGGIPNAYNTGPRWFVKEENAEKSYVQVFEKPPMPSPHQSRSNSAQQISYHQQIPQHMQNGQHGIPQISAPMYTTPHQAPYAHYDESHRMAVPVSTASSQYVSPRLQSTQMGMTGYNPAMGHHLQMAYGQMPQFYASQAGQPPAPMRQFSGQQFMHSPAAQMATPVMMPQGTPGTYMAVPAQFQQMPMQSPGAAYAFPQQNGYPSPGRSAPMMHQGSQQGHSGGQPMMYTMSQQNHTPYGHQARMGNLQPSYGTQSPYGSSPRQVQQYPMRTMSSGYGGKMMQQMPSSHGPPPGAPQQPSAYGQSEA